MADQRKNRHYTDDFKQEALRLAVRGEKSLTQVAEDLGIRRDLLQRLETGGAPGGPGGPAGLPRARQAPR